MTTLGKQPADDRLIPKSLSASADANIGSLPSLTHKTRPLGEKRTRKAFKTSLKGAFDRSSDIVVTQQYPILGYRVQLRYSRAVSKRQFTQAEDIFRKLLKELRQQKNLTQTQLADRLGLPQSYISKYEAGERRLDFVETFFVCDALGIGIEDLAKAFSAELSNKGRRKRG